MRLRAATLTPEIVYPCGNAWKEFVAEESNQLSISKGDVIVVTQRSGDFWWWGTNENTQVSGYFPKGCLWFHTPWRRFLDKTHNTPYFVNVMTGASMWEVPEGFVENDEVTPADLIVVEGADSPTPVVSVAKQDNDTKHNGKKEAQTPDQETKHDPSTKTTTTTTTTTSINLDLDERKKIISLGIEVRSLRQDNATLRKRNAFLEGELVKARSPQPQRAAVLKDIRTAATTTTKTGKRQKRGTVVFSTHAKTNASFHPSTANEYNTTNKSRKTDLRRLSSASSYSRGGDEARGSSMNKVNRRGRRNEVTAEVIGKKEMKAVAESQRTANSKTSTATEQTTNIRHFLSEAIANNVLFIKLEHDVLFKVVKGFTKEVTNANEDIIVQGDKGEYFYVVQKGECHVLIEHQHFSLDQTNGGIIGHSGETGESNHVGPVMHGSIGPGGTFGELALMYNQPRQATIRAVVDTVLWKISRRNFQLIVATHEREKKRKNMNFLRGVPMLAKLSSSQLNDIADVVGTETFTNEEPVYLSEETSTMLYIIESGSVELRLMRRGKTGSFHAVEATDGPHGSSAKASFASTRDSRKKLLGMAGRPSMFQGVEQNKNLCSGDYFGTEAMLSTAMGIEHVAKKGAYAVGARTELITLAAEHLIRIAGKAWLKAYATGIDVNQKQGHGAKTTVSGGTGGGGGNGGSSIPILPLTLPQKSNEEGEEEKDSLGALDALGGKKSKPTPGPVPVHARSRTISEYSAVQLPDNWRDTAIGGLKDLEMMQVLGKGSFGEVILAKLTGTNRLVAVKKLKKQDLASSGCAPHVMNERKALAISSGCPFIVNMFNTFSDKRYLYFILELCRGGDLFGLLCKKERVVEKDARFYAATVLNAFGYMHERDIIYRDLKPENLLITENGYLKVADLGLAKAVPEGVTYTMCGTPVYMAPEMLLSSGHGKPADAWAIGIMVYELCGGYPPFEGEDQMSTYELIINAGVTWPVLDGSSATANKLDNQEQNNDMFLDAEIVNQYKFGSSMKELILSLLIKDPTKRAGGGTASQKPFQDVIKSRWFSGFDWNAFHQQKMTPPVVPIVGDWLENFEEYDEEEEAIEYEGDLFLDFEKE